MSVLDGYEALLADALSKALDIQMQGELEVRSTWAGDLVVAPVHDRDIREGMVFIGPNHAIYLATSDCNDKGWLFVRNLGVDQTATRSDGSLMCEGFYAYSYPTIMHLVVSEA